MWRLRTSRTTASKNSSVVKSMLVARTFDVGQITCWSGVHFFETICARRKPFGTAWRYMFSTKGRKFASPVPPGSTTTSP